MNSHNIDTTRLLNFLESLDPYFDRQIKLYALGGTALTLLQIKTSTIDIDFNVATKKEYDYTQALFEKLGFEKTGPIRFKTQEGIAFDLFHSEYILGTQLPQDCLSKSKLIKQFSNLTIYTLPIVYIIISKLARADTRDYEDIKTILEVETIDLQELLNEYKAVAENSVISKYKTKILEFFKFNLPDLYETVRKEVDTWN